MAVAVAACSAQPAPETVQGVESAPRTTPLGRGMGTTRDTVLITIETTRADRVGPLYGHPRGTFPWLSSHAETGRVYTRAYAASSWTLPSVVSLYTGLSPLEHGVEAIDRQLPASVHPLGVALERQDVQAAFFGVNPVFVVDRGLARGFDHWQAEVGWPAGRLNQAVLQWVDTSRAPTRPLFLHVHYFDPHCPYIPPRSSTVAPALTLTNTRIPADRLEEMGGCYRIDRADGTPEVDIDVYLERYDRELRGVDEALQRLVTRLAERGLTGPEDRLIITSDHGEAFWEHDDYGHSHTLWAETTRVPLVIWDSGGAGTVDAPVGLTGLTSFLREGPTAPPIRPERAGPTIQATRAAGTPWVAVIDDTTRWISDGTRAWKTDPRSDPTDAKLKSVSAQPEPNAIQQARAVAHPPSPLTPTPSEAELLRALGYTL